MTRVGLKSITFAASSFVLLGLSPAYAGADSIRAEAYFNAIAGGDADTIASFYTDDAEFHWVGGPLAGVYKGKDKIKGVWENFSKAAGALRHEVLQLSESTSGRASTVTARVKFVGAGEVPVKFIMLYKDGKIASETWQVDKPATAKNEAKPEPKTAATPAPQPAPAVEEALAPQAAPAAAPAKAPAQIAVVDAPPAPAGGSPEADYLPKSGKASQGKSAATTSEDAPGQGQTSATASAPGSAPAQAAPKKAAPAAQAKADPKDTDPRATEPKAKVAEAPKPRKKRYDDDYEEGYGYGGYRDGDGYGGYRDGYGYRGYGYGGGYRSGGGWGWGGYGGGYGRGYGGY